MNPDRKLVIEHLRGSADGMVQTLHLTRDRVEAALCRVTRAQKDLELEHARLDKFASFVEQFLLFVARCEAGDVSDDQMGEVSIRLLDMMEEAA